MSDARTCSHCLRPMRGHASVNDDWLCHPDDGMDCYHLVTVYKHKMPCPECQMTLGYMELALDPEWSAHAAARHRMRDRVRELENLVGLVEALAVSYETAANRHASYAGEGVTDGDNQRIWQAEQNARAIARELRAILAGG